MAPDDTRSPSAVGDTIAAPNRPVSAVGDTLAVPDRAPDVRFARTVAPPPVHASRARLESGAFADRYGAAKELLGEGGMGRVLLTEDRVIGRDVAMKLVRHGVGSEGLHARFVREARVQGQLEHPSVVPVYDLGVAPDGTAYFTMKRVVGVTFAEIIDRLRAGAPATDHLSRRRLLTAFGAVCLAVDFAHERRVVHRDLKPANLMVGDHGEVYVLDWGVARVRGESTTRGASFDDEATGAGVVVGTPGYMPPEQLRGEQERVGPAADLYSLGAILFELLTLEPLHVGHDLATLVDSITRGADARASVRAPTRDVPPELESICVRATSTDPADRYPSARAMYEAIDRFLNGERDIARRRELAATHAQTAAAGLATGVDVAARKQAMREVGRALALDPENQEALRLLVRLLDEPPRDEPAEVAARMAGTRAAHHRYVAKVSGVAYASLLLYLPVLAWMGIRDRRAVGAFYLFALAASAASFLISRARMPTQWMIVLLALLSDSAFAATSRMLGPLVLTPAMIISTTIAFAVHFDRIKRFFVFFAGAATLLVPLALEQLGALEPSYRFVDGALVIVPHTLGLPPGPTLAVLAIANVSAIATGVLGIARVRDDLVESERKLELQAWQIRQLVPEEALGDRR